MCRSRRKSRSFTCTPCRLASASSLPTSKAPTLHRPGRRMGASWRSSSPRTAIRRSTRSMPTAVACSASPSRPVSIPSPVTRPMAARSTSPPTAAAARRSIRSAPMAAIRAVSPSRVATTSRRARRRTARASPSSPGAKAASSSP
ncbi:hypothetical protein SDC9_165434 [bioreactor metagenome]|uniref:Uncharacterized protein n=1 Tax=bioreactor metagenome TaxID=1076179 RepID=A0A645FW50_9ZZZZ